jgi:hypothetical protein
MRSEWVTSSEFYGQLILEWGHVKKRAPFALWQFSPIIDAARASDCDGTHKRRASEYARVLP